MSAVIIVNDAAMNLRETSCTLCDKAELEFMQATYVI